jgi:hypothetical protein
MNDLSNVPGIMANQDPNAFFWSRPDTIIDQAEIDSWLDKYANAQVKELVLSVNCKRTTYRSDVWESMMDGYDPEGGDDQPIFSSIKPEDRHFYARPFHRLWQVEQDGIDLFAAKIDGARKRGISPYLSMRMNDVHSVHDIENVGHNEFWRKNPQYWRVGYRLFDWSDRGFDYAHPEVREHHMKLVREILTKYDPDGLELDWMRTGHHFRPGHEAEGCKILTQFMADVREFADEQEKKRGHKIKISARVPANPQTAVAMGMDGVTWARKGLVDVLVATPLWGSADTDMPIEIWRELLRDTGVTLATGIELLLRPSPDMGSIFNSIETDRGNAISMLDRGSERVYLFNHHDGGWEDRPETFRTVMSELGSLETMINKPRRHVVTYQDLLAPGEPERQPLPTVCTPDVWKFFRLHIGPKPVSGEAMVVIGVMEPESIDANAIELYVNAEKCEFAGPVQLQDPYPAFPTYGFTVPVANLNRGYNVIELTTSHSVKIGWVELSIKP